MSNYTENVTFMTMNEFKAATKSNELDLLRNPNGEKKLFLASDNGKNYKAQQTIDLTKPVKMLIPESGDLDLACITNVKPGAEVIASF